MGQVGAFRRPDREVDSFDRHSNLGDGLVDRHQTRLVTSCAGTGGEHEAAGPDPVMGPSLPLGNETVTFRFPARGAVFHCQADRSCFARLVAGTRGPSLLGERWADVRQS